MKRIVQSIVCVLVFTVLVTASLPVKSYNLWASVIGFDRVTVTDGDKVRTYTTDKPTVAGFFRETDIILQPKDLCDRALHEAVWDGMEIRIVRGMTVQVGIDNAWRSRRVAADTTVRQLQTLLQNELGTALLFHGDGGRGLTANEHIAFSTWRGAFHTTTEAVPYATHASETARMRDGTMAVRQAGVPGEQAVTTAVIHIGGREREREVTDVTLLTAPIDELIDVGIGGRLGSRTDTSAPDFHYREKLLMNASAYTAGFGCTGKNPGDPGYGITATGRQVQPGIVSVDPRVIPLGTHLYVEGYGFSLAADTGGAIKGHKIDLFHEELSDALKFGRRNLTVYVLD